MIDSLFFSTRLFTSYIQLKRKRKKELHRNNKKETFIVSSFALIKTMG